MAFGFRSLFARWLGGASIVPPRRQATNVVSSRAAWKAPLSQQADFGRVVTAAAPRSARVLTAATLNRVT